MRGTNHPNIIKLISFSESDEHYFLVLERKSRLCRATRKFSYALSLQSWRVANYSIKSSSLHTSAKTFRDTSFCKSPTLSVTYTKSEVLCIGTSSFHRVIFAEADFSTVTSSLKTCYSSAYPSSLPSTRFIAHTTKKRRTKANSGRESAGEASALSSSQTLACRKSSGMKLPRLLVVPSATLRLRSSRMRGELIVLKGECVDTNLGSSANRYSSSVDMWALGCVLYTLLCGFPRKSKLYRFHSAI